MDPAIWSHLPDEVLDRVVALLPLPTIINLRPTCKRFHSLLLSPSFLSLHHATSTSSSSFLILSHPQFSHKFLPLYSAATATATWHTTPLLRDHPPFLFLWPPPLLSLPLPLPPPLQPPHRLLPLRPLPRRLRRRRHRHPHLPPLPPSPRLPNLPPRLLLQPNPPLLLPLQLLDSLPHCRQCLCRRPCRQRRRPLRRLSLFHNSRPLVHSKIRPRRRELGLRGDQFAFVRLVGGRGGEGLFLVGGVGPNGISRSLRVWEMVAERGWEERGIAPEGMCRKFMSVCYYNYAHVYCLWHEGMVCVCCTTWPEVLYFKVARGVWHWLPRCPFLQNKWSCGFRWFSFVPDLFALV